MKKTIFVLGTYKSGSSFLVSSLGMIPGFKQIPGSTLSRSDSGYYNLGEFVFFSDYGGLLDCFNEIDSVYLREYHGTNLNDIKTALKTLLISKFNLKILAQLILSLRDFAYVRIFLKNLSTTFKILNSKEKKTYFVNELEKLFINLDFSSNNFFFDHGLRLDQVSEQLLELFPGVKIIMVLRNPDSQILELIIQKRHLIKYNELLAIHYGSSPVDSVTYLLDYINYQTEKSFELIQKYPDFFSVVFFEDLIESNPNGIKEVFDHLDFNSSNLSYEEFQRNFLNFSRLKYEISDLSINSSIELDLTSNHRNMINKIINLQIKIKKFLKVKQL